MAISPMVGGIFFQKALREGQVVEAAYYQADGYGDKKVDDKGNTTEIVEFLSLPVRLEIATRVTGKEFSFNPEGKTISPTFEPLIWAGSDLQNFAGTEDCEILGNSLIFAKDVLAEGEDPIDPYDPWRHEPVKITYGVLEAFGGEQAYSVSTLPVYRKPFFIEAAKTDFTLEGDRTADFPPNSLMLVGLDSFYITGAAIVGGSTTVSFFPPTQLETGSRSPGNDVPLQISDLPVAWPDPHAADRGSFGFLMEISLPYLDVDKGQHKIVFLGDATRFTRPSHLLELGGFPHLVVNSKLTDDGRYTIVNVSSAFHTKHTFGASTTKFSTRAVYTQKPVEFAGILPVEMGEAHTLFRRGTSDSEGELPGKALIPQVDYIIDGATGSIQFKFPNQKPLSKNESLWFTYTAKKTVSPLVQDNAIIAPVFAAKNLSIATPSVENRILGSYLKAQYTFRNPDSFYFNVLSLKDYLPQVSDVSKAQVRVESLLRVLQ